MIDPVLEVRKAVGWGWRARYRYHDSWYGFMTEYETWRPTAAWAIRAAIGKRRRSLARRQRLESWKRVNTDEA